jgi:hypothetical protein
MLNPGGRGADRAGVCLNNLDEKGSHGGSPSLQITSPDMSHPGGRGADRAGICLNNLDEKGSHGGSPSLKSSPIQPNSSMHSESRNQRNSTSRKHNASKRAAPRPKTPPLLESITIRRRLEEYTRGEIFERTLGSASLDFAMIPCP